MENTLIAVKIKWLLFMLVSFLSICCSPAKANLGREPYFMTDEEIFGSGAVPGDGSFEYRSLDWWEYFDANWVTFPSPDWEVPDVIPWPELYLDTEQYYIEGQPDWDGYLPAYPDGWFQDANKVPVRPSYFWSPSANAWSVRDFIPRQWFVQQFITNDENAGGNMASWVDIDIDPKRGFRMLVLFSDPLHLPVRDSYSFNNISTVTELISTAHPDYEFYMNGTEATVSQYIFLFGGETIRGRYLFCTSDWFNDWAKIKLIPFDDVNYPEIELAYISVADVGRGGNSGWRDFSYKVPIAYQNTGWYIHCGVYDSGDWLVPSALLVDDIVICRESSECDLYRDCHVDFRDFAEFAQTWKEYPPDGWPHMDFNDDGVVDFLDIAEFADNWLMGER